MFKCLNETFTQNSDYVDNFLSKFSKNISKTFLVTLEFCQLLNKLCNIQMNAK